MTIDKETGISMFGSREVSNNGTHGILTAAEEMGISFIGRYGKPTAMVLPLSIVGIKRTFALLEKLMKRPEDNLDDAEFVAVMQDMIDKYKIYLAKLESKSKNNILESSK